VPCSERVRECVSVCVLCELCNRVTRRVLMLSATFYIIMRDRRGKISRRTFGEVERAPPSKPESCLVSEVREDPKEFQ